MAVQDVLVLVLPDPDSKGGKGGLFERFIARHLAEQYGFESPTSSNLNVTSDGIELDVTARHKLTGGQAIAECKAYNRSVKAAELAAFYGKLTIERFEDASAFGLMVALPRLTADGEEKAREIEARDSAFKYLSANDIGASLQRDGVVAGLPALVADASDHAILITEHGVFAACIELDAAERTPKRVAVWGTAGEPVPSVVIELLADSDYALGNVVYDAGGKPAASAASAAPVPAPAPLLTRVVGSGSDFEYQLPASPKFFVGRRAVVERLGRLADAARGSVVVLNAQSGWGKSSLALKLLDLVNRTKGTGSVYDARTANDQRYVVEALRQATLDAEQAGIVEIPTAASWATLESSLATLRGLRWLSTNRPVLIFFDQFENVFRSADLTRVFRDLALGIRDVNGPVIIGFAWKTDLVGWTEGHPFQLRDDIRSAGSVVLVEPFGPGEVDTILRRLAKQASVPLVPDLRSRLRQYSQGLPWLLKKLADHVLRELSAGQTQEALLAESLNVIGLFEADLAELNPIEQGVLRHIAKFAPTAAVEVTERFGPESVQSLVDRRLVVQVGDRLDTYWDTFRDFLNTGNVPVQESWILRQTPNSVGRLLATVLELGGNASVKDLCDELRTSDRVIFNLSRELRLLGVTAHEPNRVRIIDEVLQAGDLELETRRRVSSTLRRHRAFSTFRDLADRMGGSIAAEAYRRDLPNAFPAVAVADVAWSSYARVFLAWLEYAGLVVRRGGRYSLAGDTSPTGTIRLLDARSPVKSRPGVPQIGPRRAIDILKAIDANGEVALPTAAKDREAAIALHALGAINVRTDKMMTLKSAGLVTSAGDIDPATLKRLLLGVPGGRSGIEALEGDPSMGPFKVGMAISTAIEATWTKGTTHGIGGYFRAWAKLAGLRIEAPPRRTGTARVRPSPSSDQGELFGTGPTS